MKKLQFLLLAITIAIMGSCTSGKTEISTAEKLKEELMNSFKSEMSQSSFTLKSIQSESETTLVMKNKKVGKKVVFARGDSSLILGFIAQREKQATSSSLSKVLIVKKDSSISLEVRNPQNKVSLNQRIDHSDLPLVAGHPDGFDSIEDCIDEFFCALEAAQCEVNRTCEPRFFGITCCLKSGNCVAIDYYFKPTSPFCRGSILVLDPPILVAQF